MNLCRLTSLDNDHSDSDWSLDQSSKSLLYPPDDLATWFSGEIEFLQEQFNKTLKAEALQSLKKQDAYTDTQFVAGAVLPSRWHEGQQPLPNFWLVEQWDWIAEGGLSTGRYLPLLLTNQHVAGNSMWERPTHLLYHVLKAKPALTYREFKRVLDSIMKNVRASSDLSSVHPLATNLWMGETPWRKFAKDLLTIHLHQSVDDVPPTWDTIGNP